MSRLGATHLTRGTLIFFAQFIVTILGILTLLFFLQRLSGDPAIILAGHNASAEVIEAVREDMGLNEPIYVQYGIFLRDTLSLDFGDSARQHQPALQMVLDRFPATLLLAVSALGLAILVGVPLAFMLPFTSIIPAVWWLMLWQVSCNRCRPSGWDWCCC